MARRTKARRRWFERLVLLGLLSLSAISLVVAAGLWWADEKANELPRVAVGRSLSQREVVDTGDPRNFLIVGADSVSTLPADDPLRADRSDAQRLTDTLMVLRVDPTTESATLLSIPRDLFVPISGAGYSARINSALAIGGSETLIRTVQDVLGIPIHNYVEADFNGFRQVVDAIDGVPIYIPFPMRDARVGFLVEEAGCRTLFPDEALAYVRSRAMEGMVDGEWVSLDIVPDLGRIDRQQDFIVAALQRAISKGGLRSPSTSLDLIDSAISAVTLDEVITRRELLDLGTQFQAFQANSLETYTLPVADGLIDEQQILVLVDAEAQPILRRFRGGDSVVASDIRIRVLNGTGAPGLAASVGEDLEGLGLQVVSRSDAGTFDFEVTVFRYPPGNVDVARAVGLSVVGGQLVEDSAITDVDLEVTVGRDYGGIAAPLDLSVITPGPADPAPEAAPTDASDPAAAPEAAPVCS